MILEFLVHPYFGYLHFRSHQHLAGQLFCLQATGWNSPKAKIHKTFAQLKAAGMGNPEITHRWEVTPTSMRSSCNANGWSSRGRVGAGMTHFRPRNPIWLTPSHYQGLRPELDQCNPTADHPIQPCCGDYMWTAYKTRDLLSPSISPPHHKNPAWPVWKLTVPRCEVAHPSRVLSRRTLQFPSGLHTTNGSILRSYQAAEHTCAAPVCTNLHCTQTRGLCTWSE